MAKYYAISVAGAHQGNLYLKYENGKLSLAGEYNPNSMDNSILVKLTEKEFQEKLKALEKL